MIAMERKELHGHRYAVHKTALIDTVPVAFADQWLSSAPQADTLILCNPNPYPKTVRRFLNAHPNGKIYAPHYTAYVLEGILGDAANFQLVRDKKAVDDITLTVTSQSGKGSYLTADCGLAGIWSGADHSPFPTAEHYDVPTVAICYVSGCDYTETLAETIAQGIRDTEGLDTRLIDLAGTDTQSVLPMLVNAAGLLIGTPTVDGEAPRCVWDLLTAMGGGSFSGKFSSAFGAYTWNGSATAHVIERMKQLNMNVIDGGYSVQNKPDEAALKSTYEYGYYFGCKLQNKPNTHQSKLVKCIVCGEIFDASLGICPVCGVGMDKCVPVDDELISYKADTDRTYLIAGGGTAALSAAEAIRNRDKTGKIIMISKEDSLPINRPMLSKKMVIAARVNNSLDIKPQEWFAEQQIDLRLDTTITAIDAQAKTAAISDGTKIPYDKFIYAMGAECFVLPIPGSDLDGVITVRHLADVYKIWKKLPSAKNAVVIGGGVLGLEAASELKKMRLSVTVLEAAPKLMSRQLDDEAGDALVAAAAQYGISIHTGVNISKITGEDAVSAVVLDDGTTFPADLVVMSCGNRANIDVAKTAGIGCERAIVVNERMETNLSDIYAAGDCVQLHGVNFQLWAEATEQGRVAGANAVGDPVKFIPTPLGASFEGMNTQLFAIGDVGKGGKEYKTMEFRDNIEHSFRKYWFVNNRIVGGILFGNTDRTQTLTDALNVQKSYFTVKNEL